jgi:hypothetical protein
MYVRRGLLLLHLLQLVSRVLQGLVHLVYLLLRLLQWQFARWF